MVQECRVKHLKQSWREARARRWERTKELLWSIIAFALVVGGATVFIIWIMSPRKHP